MNDASRGVLRIGSAAMALAYLACGRIDGFWAIALHPWDLAAGILTVTEAGGRIASLSGENYSFNDKYCIGGNKKINSELITIIKQYA